MTTNGARRRILVLPKPSLYRQLFTPQTDNVLKSVGDVTFNTEERDWPSEELANRVGEYDIVVTSWRSPRFTDEVFTAATRLKLIAHSAGSVRFMVPDDVLDRGIAVTSAAAAMAPSVAETTLLFIMLQLRPLHRQDQGLRAGEDWMPLKTAGMGNEVAGQRVGLVGAGYVGRAVVKLLRAVGMQVCVYDPYLTDAAAAEMGVERIPSLEALLTSCRIVSLHAPSTPQTNHMIGTRELGLLRDGSILINTARSSLVDQDALLHELQTGRISAALDVFDEEPLPATSGFRKLNNVFITPHLAAATIECRFRQGDITADEVRRFASGQPLRYGLTAKMIAIMA